MLTRLEQDLLAHLYQLSGKYGMCRPSRRGLAEMFGVSERHIRRLFQALERAHIGWRDYEDSTPENKETAIWRFFGSDAYFDWVVSEMKREDGPMIPPEPPLLSEAQITRITKATYGAYVETVDNPNW